MLNYHNNYTNWKLTFVCLFSFISGNTVVHCETLCYFFFRKHAFLFVTLWRNWCGFRYSVEWNAYLHSCQNSKWQTIKKEIKIQFITVKKQRLHSYAFCWSLNWGFCHKNFIFVSFNHDYEKLYWTFNVLLGVLYFKVLK